MRVPLPPLVWNFHSMDAPRLHQEERGGEGRGGLLFGRWRWRRRRCCGAARCCNVTRRCTAFDSCLLPSPLFLREQEHSLEGGGPNWLTPSSNRTAPRSPPSKFRCRLPPPPRHHPPPSLSANESADRRVQPFPRPSPLSRWRDGGREGRKRNDHMFTLSRLCRVSAVSECLCDYRSLAVSQALLD